MKNKNSERAVRGQDKNLPEGFSETGIVQLLPGAWVLYCSTIEFYFADKITEGDEKHLIINQGLDRKMFDPECQNIECPQCFLGKVYFDREIGHYCMYCGGQFNVVDMEILIEKNALMSHSAQKSGDTLKKLVVEIKELPPRKAKVVHFSRDVIKSEEPDR